MKEKESGKTEREEEQNSKSCNDKSCPVHGKLKVRGRVLTGKVTTARMQRTATVESERRHFIPKYQRYEKRRTVIKAHNPDCISAKAGDTVIIAECRPLSKTKKFVITKKLN